MQGKLPKPEVELADHFESLSVSPASSPLPNIRKSARVASRSSSAYSTPIRRPIAAKQPTAKRKKVQLTSDSDDSNGSNYTHGKKKPSRSRLGKGERNLIENGLPGREQECELLREKISDALSTQQGCCIYISGVPGTGKTATLRQTVYFLSSSSTRNKFDFIEINGMKLTDPSQAYSILWEKISGRSLSGGVALKRLCKHFETKSKKRLSTIVLLDELDLLLKKKSSILYHFFEWTGWSSSRLIVIAIANTMDLPERFLPNRIASRMGTNRINFKPYTYPQLMAIIGHRLAAWQHLFHPDALEYCARKVSAVSGDARRALALAKRAIDWVQRNPSLLGSSKLITIPLMEQAIQMTFAGNPVQLMSDLALQQKYLLLATLLSARAAGAREVKFEKVCESHWQLLRAANHSTAISFSALQSIFNSLETSRLVSRCSGGALLMASSMVRLCVPEEEVTLALKRISAFQKYLQQLS